MNRCATAGCARAPLASSGGWVYALCAAHVRSALSAAFRDPNPEPVSWWALARANRLPPSVVDGSPRPDPLTSAAGVPPVPGGARQVAGAATPGIGTG